MRWPAGWVWIFWMVGTNAALADGPTSKGPGWLLPLPEVDADPKIPTLKAIVGHDWAEEITTPAEADQYLQAIAAAAPDRATYVRYGRTPEGRSLAYVAITSPENRSRLDAIREANLRLADPRITTKDEAQRLAKTAPAVVWMAYGVHGDELSSTDAALLTAYHLLADRRASTRLMLDALVVILDPMQNPDGRDRFLNFHRENRGVAPDPEPLSADRVQRWATGRHNHYLFDMNRDWFLQTQSETRDKVAAYLRWQPQVFIDAHEMGANSHYYFDPPADPIIELITPNQRSWFTRFGRRQGGRFDAFGFPYTTREVYDAFYPGYGSTWPTLHASIGMLWEQAGARGLVVDREDQTKLYYHDGVRHHYISGLSTVETAAAGKEHLLRDFYEGRASAVELGKIGPVRDYLILPGSTPSRLARLGNLLVRNGIEVREVTEPLKLKAKTATSPIVLDREVPIGSLHLAVAQPAGRLVRALLDPQFDMGDAFRKRQLDRKARRLDDEIYDVTAWSLPVAHGLTSLPVTESLGIKSERFDLASRHGRVIGPVPAKVGYLIPAEDEVALIGLGQLLVEGFRAHVFDEPTTLAGRKFAKGTILLRTSDNPETLHERVRSLASSTGLTIQATDTGLVDEGAGLGGMNVSWIKPPRVAMIVDRPTSPFAGHTWYLFEQVWRYPLTRVTGTSVVDLDLSKYNVLILPDGRYPGPLTDTFIARLKDWVRAGGTLILVKGATAWASEKPVGLLATRRIKKQAKVEPGAKPDPEKKPDDDKDKVEENPDAVPGAFFRATVYDDHFVTYGSPAEVAPLVNTDLILAPVKPTDGRNLVTFALRPELLIGGFCWPETLDLMSGKPLVVYQSLGKGHVVGFADDPNYRAMTPALQRLFFNAVVFGPGH